MEVNSVDYERLRTCLINHASKRWTSIRTATAEDLAQEALLMVWIKRDKIVSDKCALTYACSCLDRIAKEMQLKEHKDLMCGFSEACLRSEDGDDKSLYEMTNRKLEYVIDPWLEEHNAQMREYYYKNREKMNDRYRKRYQAIKNFQEHFNNEHSCSIKITDAIYLYGALRDEEKYAARLNEIVEKYKQKGKEIKVKV